jgi:hypothetical protein
MNGFKAEGSIVRRIDYIGDENLVVNGTTLPCSKLRETVTVTAASGTGPGQTETTTVEETFWYNATIRYFVRDELKTFDNHGKQVGTTNVRMLTSYYIP